MGRNLKYAINDRSDGMDGGIAVFEIRFAGGRAYVGQARDVRAAVYRLRQKSTGEMKRLMLSASVQVDILYRCDDPHEARFAAEEFIFEIEPGMAFNRKRPKLMKRA